jgi:hypothetical protein
MADSKQVDVCSITFEKDVIETCGLHCSKQNSELHRTASNSDWSTVDQSGAFSEVILRKSIFHAFSSEFQFFIGPFDTGNVF